MTTPSSNPKRSSLGVPLLILLAALSLFITGCIAIAERVATRLTEADIEQELNVVHGQLILFHRCLKERGGSCEGDVSTPLPNTRSQSATLDPIDTRLDGALGQSVRDLGENHPAANAQQVLEHPFLAKVHTLYNRLHGLDNGSGAKSLKERQGADGATELTFTAPVAEIQDFSDRLHTSLTSGSWAALANHVDQHMTRQGTADRADHHARTLAYIRAYFAAYFENGRFVQIELDTQDVTAFLDSETGELAGKLDAFLAQRFPTLCGAKLANCAALKAELVQKISSQIATRVGKTYIFGKVQTQGFISRDGTQLSVPQIHVDPDPLGQKPLSVNTIDLVAVGGDLISVLLEATFDAHEGLPAVSSATGLHLKNSELALPAFVSPLDKVDTQAFEDIANLSQRASTSVHNILSRGLQGVGPFGLNNPALESLIGAAVGTTVKKITAKATWCWYACGFAQDLEEVKEQAKKAEKQATQDLKQVFDKEGQRIRLKVKVQ